jgi:hypothetical protein
MSLGAGDSKIKPLSHKGLMEHMAPIGTMFFPRGSETLNEFTRKGQS